MMAEANRNSEEMEAAKRERLQQIKKNTKGPLFVCFILFIAVHIAMIVVASIYMKNCPLQPEISPLLLTMGILGFVSKLITLCGGFIAKHMDITLIMALVGMAELGVLIAASYYVYKVFEPSYDVGSGDQYCNKTLYMFSFIYITVTYFFILMVIIAICCICCLTAFVQPTIVVVNR